MKNQKSKFVIIFLVIIAICDMRYAICRLYAQDKNKLDALSKQIMEAKSNNELYLAFEELADLYFNENKYNEFVEFLNSSAKQKKTLEPTIDYYIALCRYYQLKHLEEKQSWDEYFSQGNNYRDELTKSAQKTIDSLGPADVLGVYARLILWKFHRDQQDALSEGALSDLMNSVLTYAKDATNLVPLKDVASQLMSYNEKAKAGQIYKIYVDKIVASNIKEDELNTIASGFYKEGNLELSEGLYDVYIERITKSTPREKLIPILIDIAKLFTPLEKVHPNKENSLTGFTYKDEGLTDAFYAEKVFKKIEEIGTKDAFDEGLMYLRAFNLEKAKEYKSAKDGYIELVKRYPQTIHNDEADFKTGIIYTYVLRDIKTGRTYFEKLSQKETLSPQGISSLYQLGLLSQWEEDFIKAKEYYNKLIEKAGPVRNTEPLERGNKISNGAGDGFTETVNLAKERLKEIEETKPINYNLKTFLDVSLKEEYAMLDASKLDLRSHPYKTKKNEVVNINSTPYMAESGCFQIELQYLWSGHIGTAKPPLDEPAFNTHYTDNGTKEINLVVVSPTGIVDRNIDMVDVY